MKKAILYCLIGIIFLAGVFFGRTLFSANDEKTVYALIPMTGSLAELGQKIKGSMNLFMDDNHPDFKVKFVDSASSPDQAIKAINQAVVNDNKPIVITAFSFIANAIIPTVDEKGGFVFAIATASINSQIRERHHNFQRISTGIEDVIAPLLNHIPDGIRSISIVYSNDEYGMENRKCFSTGFVSRGGSIVEEVPFNLSSPVSRETIFKVVNGNPDGIFVTGSASLSYINIFKDILATGYKGRIFADAAFSNTVVLNTLGDLANNIIFVATEADLENASSEKTKRFRQGCQRIGVDPYFMTAEAYDVVALISYLRTSGLVISQETLQTMKTFESVAEEIKFLKDGDCWYECCAVKMQDGKIVKLQ